MKIVIIVKGHSNQQVENKNGSKEIITKEDIMHHLADAHEWHFWGD